MLEHDESKHIVISPLRGVSTSSRASLDDLFAHHHPATPYLEVARFSRPKRMRIEVRNDVLYLIAMSIDDEPELRIRSTVLADRNHTPASKIRTDLMQNLSVVSAQTDRESFRKMPARTADPCLR